MAELTYEQKLDLLWARNDVSNVMGKYVYFHYANEYEKLAQLFALDRDDVTAEISNWGVYKGGDSIRRLYPVLHQKYLLGDGKGRLHATASPPRSLRWLPMAKPPRVCGGSLAPRPLPTMRTSWSRTGPGPAMQLTSSGSPTAGRSGICT